MEFILILAGILIFSVFAFILIEYPYYLVSLFVFLYLYSFNFPLPGPLDLRGLLSVALLLRLVVFDKENLNLLKELITNKFFLLILLFSFYCTAVNFFTGSSIIYITRNLILNFGALILAFLTIRRGYGMKTIVLTILIVGILTTGDLIYSYFVRGKLRIVKILDFNIHQSYNHNFFGMLCGDALITTSILLIYKHIKKTISYILFICYGLGILVSTSRTAIFAIVIMFLLILFTQNQFKVNFKKVFTFSFFGAIILIMIFFSYSYILSAMNIKSEFADQIYFRLVQEPMSIFSDNKEYTSEGEIKKGNFERTETYLRDIDVFFKQKNNIVLLGFGQGGYSEIALVRFRGKNSFQYSSHNFFINLVAELGIIGLCLFFLFFIPLLINAIKMIRKGRLHFSLVYLLFFMLLFSFGHGGDFTEQFGFLLYGAIIAEFFQAQHSEKFNNNEQNEIA